MKFGLPQIWELVQWAIAGLPGKSQAAKRAAFQPEGRGYEVTHRRPEDPTDSSKPSESSFSK